MHSRLDPLSSGEDAARDRARKNWQRAYRLVIRQIVIGSLGVQRKFKTLAQMFTQLHGSPSHSSLQESSASGKKDRAPILLLLGGGMAAGKSTVREIIGSDTFWSKASIFKISFVLQILFRSAKMLLLLKLMQSRIKMLFIKR